MRESLSDLDFNPSISERDISFIYRRDLRVILASANSINHVIICNRDMLTHYFISSIPCRENALIIDSRILKRKHIIISIELVIRYDHMVI